MIVRPGLTRRGSEQKVTNSSSRPLDFRTVPLHFLELSCQLTYHLHAGCVAGRAPAHLLCDGGHCHPKCSKFPGHFSTAEGCKPHPLRQVSCSRRANDGMTQLGDLSLQKGELLKMLSVLLLRCLLRPTLLRKLVLKEGDFLCKILGVGKSRGERCRILYLHSRLPLQFLLLHLSSPVLGTLDMKICAVLHHSSFLSPSLNSKHDSSMSGLCSGDGLSPLGHPCLQDGNIYATMR
jgi:hypothetical protein